MRDRIKNIGGSVDIVSQKSEGTIIRVNWDALSDESLI
jgi:signal transduction histidine kinase